MIVSCPACKYEYEVESGKYQCGICGVKFFAFRNGLVELAANSPVPALPPAGNAKKRFQAGELILGHYRVIAASAPDAKEIIYKCLDENTNQEVSLKDLFPDVAIADVSSARFQKIDTPVVAAAPVAPAPVAPAPVAPVAAAPVAPAPVAPVAPAPVAPVAAAPVAPAPVAPALKPVAPVAPAPVAPAPVAPAPVAPAPVAPALKPVAPVAAAPVAAAPVAAAPVAPALKPVAPVAPAPVAPALKPVAPVAPAPVAPAPVMPAPVAPVMPAPVAPTPVMPAPIAPTSVMPVNAGFNFQMLKISNIIILASAVVALASLFTPWVEVLEAVMGMKFWQCWLFWGIGWAVPVASVIVSKKGNALVSVVCGLVGIGFALVFYSETQFSFLGRTVDTSSFGIWIYLAAALALIGGGVVCALGKSSAGLVAGFVYDVKNIKSIFAKGK